MPNLYRTLILLTAAGVIRELSSEPETILARRA
jgi:hypothetical protein